MNHTSKNKSALKNMHFNSFTLTCTKRPEKVCTKV